ncbi:MAG: DUF4652 domain-containing protein [Clostridiales bacterium]|nr:DUF4652 domain-containing protein [Clostridiales bacterium]
MNCKTFLRKLPEYIENCMMYDMSEAMEKHMNDCKSCKQRFDEEKEIDQAFTMALDVEHISFNSCRADIMKNINKNKYSKSPINKIKYGMKKFQIQIISTAAVFLMILVSAPYVIQQYGKGGSADNGVAAAGINQESKLVAKNPNDTFAIKASEKEQDQSTKVDEKISVDENKEENYVYLDQNLDSKKIYVPEFTRVDLAVNEDLEFATAWSESPNKCLKVAIEGRGPEATEQGVGKLVFINNNTSEMWKYSLANNSRQYTPMKVSWYDNENLLVIFGYGQGRVTLGGDVILLNAYNGKAVNIYWEYSLDNKKQVVEASRNNDKIDLRVIVYDDKVINFKEEFRSISFTELYNDNKIGSKNYKKEIADSRGNILLDLNKLSKDSNNEMTVKTLEALEKYINEKQQDELSAVFSEDLLKQEDYQQLLQVNQMDLLRIINVSNSVGEGSPSIYYVEAIMDMKEEGSLYKNGINFLSICVQKDQKGNLIITDIERLPQNQI